jgi:YaiO family outer membrane protein
VSGLADRRDAQRGFRGRIIPPHRAILTLRLSGARALNGALAAVLLSVLWFFAINPVARIWAAMMRFWCEVIGFNADSEIVRHTIFGGAWVIEFPRLAAGAAPLTGGIWWAGMIATLVVFLGSYLLPRRWLPFLYLLRTAAIVQATAQLFFGIAPGAFPYDVTGYTEVLLTAGMMLIGIVPLLYGLTYFTLDFSRSRKLAIVLIAMAHLMLFIPMQYVAHAYLLHHGSLLVMPLLFWMFGLPIDVGVVIGFYAWAVSWKTLPIEREPLLHGWRPAAAVLALLGSALLFVLLFTLPAHAEDEPWRRSIELGAGAGRYTAGLGDADDQTLRFSLSRPFRDEWSANVSRASRFGETAAGLGASYKRWIRRDIALSVGLSGGSGEVLYPRYRIDAGVEHALLAGDALVETLGWNRTQSHAENWSDGAGLGLRYWFSGPWVASATGRIDVGYPGRTTSRSAGAGLTYARYKQFYLGVDGKAGTVAYTLLAPGEAFVDYWTRGIGVGSSVYFSPDFGVSARFDYAETALYDQRSVSVKLFREW